MKDEEASRRAKRRQKFEPDNIGRSLGEVREAYKSAEAGNLPRPASSSFLAACTLHGPRAEPRAGLGEIRELHGIMCAFSHTHHVREKGVYSVSLLPPPLSSAAISSAVSSPLPPPPPPSPTPPVAIACACLRVEANASRKVLSKCHIHTAFIYPSIRERKAGVALSLCSERGTPHSRFLYNRRIPHSISRHSTYTLQFRTLTKPVDDTV